MLSKTDPARELSDLCKRISTASEKAGDTVLAEHFGVEVWSAEFYQIIFMIVTRINDLQALVGTLPIDADIQAESITNLQFIKEAFGPNGLRNQWTHATSNYITPATVGPLTVLSGLVRPLQSYPKLNDAEIAELLGLIDQLLTWLAEHQLIEQDFIRQSLIEGLQRLRFRVERISWIGWGYTLDSLKDVIGAYFALERGVPTDGSNTTAEAMVKHVASFVRSFFERAQFAKDVVETGDWMLKAYGAVTLLAKGGTTIVGLISQQ